MMTKSLNSLRRPIDCKKRVLPLEGLDKILRVCSTSKIIKSWKRLIDIFSRIRL